MFQEQYRRGEIQLPISVDSPYFKCCYVRWGWCWCRKLCSSWGSVAISWEQCWRWWQLPSRGSPSSSVQPPREGSPENVICITRASMTMENKEILTVKRRLALLELRYTGSCMSEPESPGKSRLSFKSTGQYQLHSSRKKTKQWNLRKELHSACCYFPFFLRDNTFWILKATLVGATSGKTKSTVRKHWGEHKLKYQHSTQPSPWEFHGFSEAKGNEKYEIKRKWKIWNHKVSTSI